MAKEKKTEITSAASAKPACAHTGCYQPAAWSFDGKLLCTEHHNTAVEAFLRSQQTKVPAAGN